MTWLVVVMLQNASIVGGTIYLGPYRTEERAKAKAELIERAADRLEIPVSAIVEYLEEGSTSARGALEALGVVDPR